MSRNHVEKPQFAGILAGSGLLPGVVLQNTPPADGPNRGAVKVWLPQLHGPVSPDPLTLPEALVLMPWGGIAGTGVVAIPPVGSGVICGFLMGDTEKPVVLGQFYGSEGLPVEAVATPPDSALTLKHPSGWLIKIDFVEAKFEITDPTKNSIVLDTEGVKVAKAGAQATARLIHEFGVDTFTGAPLGEATQGATAAIKASQAPQ